jgi:hypothetical protein
MRKIQVASRQFYVYILYSFMPPLPPPSFSFASTIKNTALSGYQDMQLHFLSIHLRLIHAGAIFRQLLSKYQLQKILMGRLVFQTD